MCTGNAYTASYILYICVVFNDLAVVSFNSTYRIKCNCKLKLSAYYKQRDLSKVVQEFTVKNVRYMLVGVVFYGDKHYTSIVRDTDRVQVVVL